MGEKGEQIWMNNTQNSRDKWSGSSINNQIDQTDGNWAKLENDQMENVIKQYSNSDGGLSSSNKQYSNLTED